MKKLILLFFLALGVTTAFIFPLNSPTLKSNGRTLSAKIDGANWNYTWFEEDGLFLVILFDEENPIKWKIEGGDLYINDELYENREKKMISLEAGVILIQQLNVELELAIKNTNKIFIANYIQNKKSISKSK